MWQTARVPAFRLVARPHVFACLNNEGATRGNSSGFKDR
jgi:hypothetical protein